jgi:ATP-dependent Clp protease ATP-binding subunit ClpX
MEKNPNLLNHDKMVKQIKYYLESLPELTPRQFTNEIKKRGYIAQETAVKAVSLMAYRHISRLKKIYLKNIPRKNLPGKINMLFVGPTGCGKTYLIELLFKEILKLPAVIVDMTNYSETGYVGQDVASILTRLLYASNLDLASASIGIVCLDEIDKIASGQNNAVFAGAGTTKDVSGLGVQRELLKMLESAEITVPLELSHSDYAPKTLISTQDIPFIACGAFSGLKGLIERKNEYIGFMRNGLSGKQDKIAVSYTDDDVELTKHFLSYGLLPELVARFKRIIPFNSLNEKQLEDILKKNILKNYINEFRLDNINLEIDNSVYKQIISVSIKKETGARGIESALIKYLEDAAYTAYSNPGITKIKILIKDDKADYKFE